MQKTRGRLKIGNMPSGKDFFAWQGDLAQKYFVYFKAKQCGSAEKGPPIGRVDNFQTSSNSFEIL